MRGGKEEETVMQPMFPRLHVNDTDKGGPRAPPRNKMALYEQLSVPYQRLDYGVASMRPSPHCNNDSGCGSSLVPPMSSSHGGGNGKGVSTPFRDSPAPSSVPKKHLSRPSSEIKSSSVVDSQERRPTNVRPDQSLNTSKQFLSTAKGNSIQPQNFLNFKNFMCKKLGNGSIFETVSPAHSGVPIHCSNNQHGRDQENQPWLDLSFSMRLQRSSEKHKKGTMTADLLQATQHEVPSAKQTEKLSGKTSEDAPTGLSDKVRSSVLPKQAQPSINQEQGSTALHSLNPVRSSDEYHRASQSCQELKETTTVVPFPKRKAMEDTLSSPSYKVRTTEVPKRAHPSSNQEHGSISLTQQLTDAVEKTVDRDNSLEEAALDVFKKKSSKFRSESWANLRGTASKESMNSLHGVANTSPDRCRNGDKHSEYGKGRSLPKGIVERHKASEISILDCDSALDATPDAIVGIIGQKGFWEVRKAIVNQQRVFAIQVFELHRLIKIQKLIAASPHILLEDGLCIGDALPEVSPAKKVQSQYAIEQPPLVEVPKECSLKPHPGTEFVDENENTVTKLPVPSVNNETSKRHFSQLSSYSAFPASVTSSSKLSPWCFPPPGNQWLVPTMSPSEGLIYKPYMVPCSPTAGFMAPIYGGYGPASVAPSGGDFLNVAYGVPASHQQGIGILPGQAYFPQYGMPVSGSAVEQMIPLTGTDNQLAIGDINFASPQQSTCNMSSQTSRVLQPRVHKFQASKESDVQGSTASSPCGRGKGDALLLFPTEPTIQASDQITEANEPKTRVIKVVPHAATSATESAARIFKCIQEERRFD